MQRHLQEVIEPGRDVRPVEEGIYSVLPPEAGQHGEHRYDRMAAFYDNVIGSPLYTRLVLGHLPRHHTIFARDAVTRARGRTCLDAGCGSFLFTARAYLGQETPVVGLDQSIEMLRRGRDRLKRPGGSRPEQVALVQGDLFDLPFRPASFEVAVGMGLLHAFDDDTVVGLVRSLGALVEPGGRLYLTSLVTNDRPGDRWLWWIHRSGEIVPPRSGEELRALLERAPGQLTSYALQGNKAFATLAPGE